MKRKFIVSTLALFTLCVGVKAQGFADAKLGVKAGWNLANITNSKEGNISEGKNFSTFNAGFIAAVPLGSTFELRTGLDIQSKGTKTTSEFGDIKSSYKVNPLYIELPVNFDIMLPLNEKVKAYIGAGPYAAVGIAGKLKSEVTQAGETTTSSKNIRWANDNPLDGDDRNGTISSGDIKRFDFGLNVIAGLDFGKFGLHAQYGFGLTNIVPGRSNENNANKNNQHRVLGVSGIFYF